MRLFPAYCYHESDERSLVFTLQCYDIPRVGERIYLHDETLSYVVRRASHKIVEMNGLLMQHVNLLLGDEQHHPGASTEG